MSDKQEVIAGSQEAAEQVLKAFAEGKATAAQANEALAAGTDREVRHIPVTNIDSMDREMFEALVEHHKGVESMMKESKDEAFRDLLTDGFGEFYKYEPKILKKVPASREANKAVIEQLIDLPDYKHLRQFTLGDEVNSIGALQAVEKTWKALPKEVKDKQRVCGQVEAKIDDLLQDENLGELAVQKKLKGLTGKLKKAKAGMAEALQKGAGKIRVAARKALQEAAQSAEDLCDLSDSIGWGSEAGEKRKVSLDQRLALAKALQKYEKLARYARVAGRLIAIAERKQSEKTNLAKTEIEGVEFGNYLPDVVPEEFIKLDDPTLEDLFHKQFLDEKLVQYELTGRNPKGEGPIYVAIDVSGSMSAPIWNDPEGNYDSEGELKDTVPSAEEWAKGCSLALFAIARRQKRDFEAVLFDTKIQARFSCPKGAMVTAQEIEKFFGCVTWGGTAFEPPIKDFLRANGEQKDADLIFLSDGECDLEGKFVTDFLKTKAEKKFDVYTILVRCQDYDGVLKKISTDLIYIPALSEADCTNRIFSI